MSAPIGPGDWVECVDASDSDGLLVLGARYRVLAVWDYTPYVRDSQRYDCSVDLVEVPRSEPDIAWGLYRFRPDQSGDFIASLKAPPQRVKEDA